MTVQEEWKPIQGYEGLYAVSNLGNVKSLERYKMNRSKQKMVQEKILKPFVAGSGYLTVKLSKNGVSKNFKIHILVAMAFCENKKEYKEINHIDENKHNNNANNLEWCDRKYNCNYGNRNRKIAEYNLGRKKVS
jgi:hypothetical protein